MSSIILFNFERVQFLLFWKHLWDVRDNLVNFVYWPYFSWEYPLKQKVQNFWDRVELEMSESSAKELQIWEVWVYIRLRCYHICCSGSPSIRKLHFAYRIRPRYLCNVIVLLIKAASLQPGVLIFSIFSIAYLNFLITIFGIIWRNRIVNIYFQVSCAG